MNYAKYERPMYRIIKLILDETNTDLYHRSYWLAARNIRSGHFHVINTCS